MTMNPDLVSIYDQHFMSITYTQCGYWWCYYVEYLNPSFAKSLERASGVSRVPTNLLIKIIIEEAEIQGAMQTILGDLSH